MTLRWVPNLGVRLSLNSIIRRLLTDYSKRHGLFDEKQKKIRDVEKDRKMNVTQLLLECSDNKDKKKVKTLDNHVVS